MGVGYTLGMTTRESLHEMLDELPESELEALADWLRAARRGEGLEMREARVTEEGAADVDPASAKKKLSIDELRRILDAAPLDDEPETEEEREAVRESMESRPAERTSHADLMKHLGL